MATMRFGGSWERICQASLEHAARRNEVNVFISRRILGFSLSSANTDIDRPSAQADRQDLKVVKTLKKQQCT